jgi:hypothetical protein
VPEGITLTTSEMNGVLHLEATFHSSTFDPNLISRTLEMVLEDPAALIMATRKWRIEPSAAPTPR